MPATPHHHLHALIFGGGIAGLWTLARLSGAGYHCLLATTGPLGGGQTIASQGIIHGGIKYTLGLAEPGDASRRIAEMPAIWRACLEGRGEVDLRAATVLSPHQFLWTTPGLGSRIAGLGASKVIRTPVARVPPDERRGLFAGAPHGIDLYRVDEPVLAVDTVVRALAAPLAGRISRFSFPDQLRSDPPGVEVAGVRFTADRCILAAGAGNEALGAALNPSGGAVRMQRRALHMVIGRLPAPVPLFGHCLGASSLPRLTVTSAGRTWYIGGQLAEAGVARSGAEQVEAARAELRACLPWLDLSGVELSGFRVDRAEGGGQPAGRRPDGPVVEEMGNLLVGWPTKLAFAPAFAGEMLARVGAAGIGAGGAAPLPPLHHPGFAAYPWDA